MKRLVETWRSAKDDPANGQLTYQMHGESDRRYLEHGWWVQPDDWGIGVAVTREKVCAMWDGRLSLIIQIGPFTWGVDRVTSKETRC